MSESRESNNYFTYQGVYPCPVCRHGEIASLALMDAFACNFCRHIFTANLEQQSLKMADSQLPLSWHWNGQKWTGIQPDETKITWGYWIAAIAFVSLPTTIVGAASYIFPPLPGSRLAWFPLAWAIATFLSHLACIIWLILEYYQFPVSLYLRALRQRFVTR